MRYIHSFLLILLLVLYGCGYREVRVHDHLVEELSQKYNSDYTIEDQQKYIAQFTQWYNSFNNKELEALILVALSNNLDFVQAFYNLQAAALQMGDYRQALFPSLTFQGQYSKERYTNNAAQYMGVANQQGLLTLGLAASYELDIWGKNYSAYKGAQSRLTAEAARLEGAKISIIADMMNLWVNLMALREQQQLFNAKINDIQNTLDIQETNYHNGYVSITDLFQQQSHLLDIKNKLAEVNYAEAETLRSMNILMGRDPLELLLIDSNSLPQLPKLPNEDLNIMVLADRPDVAAAFYNLVASHWDVKVANLSRLPSLSLQAVLSVGGEGLKLNLDKWLLKLLAEAGMPLFRAGALLDKEKAAKLLAASNVEHYKATVFNAINELKTTLENEQKYKVELQNIQQQVDLLDATKLQLQNKYLSGDANYLEYLAANLQVTDLKFSLIEGQKNMLLNRILLYRTLGIR